MFKHNVSLDSFVEVYDDKNGDGNDDDEITNVPSIKSNIDEGRSSRHVEGLRPLQPSMESSLALINNLVPKGKEEEIKSGVQLVHHLHAMMVKVVIDIFRVEIHQSSNILYPQTIFEVVDNNTSYLIVRMKYVHKKKMST